MKAQLFLVLTLSLAIFNANATEEEIYPDTDPYICHQIRMEAQQICRSDKACYTSQVVRLTDQYNFDNGWNDGLPELYCNY